MKPREWWIDDVTVLSQVDGPIGDVYCGPRYEDLVRVIEYSEYKKIAEELDRYKRALAVAKERIERHWSGNSEDTCLEIMQILEGTEEKKYRETGI